MIRLGIFLVYIVGFLLWLILHKGEKKCYKLYHSVDVVVPAYNEEPVIEDTVKDLILNRYIRRVICVNDGSTDKTGPILDRIAAVYPEKVLVIHQKNGGKAAALNTGLERVTSSLVLLTDADTRISDDEGIGYLIAHFDDKRVAAVCGIPASDLSKRHFLPRVRASIKVTMAVIRKCAMEIVGGAPFTISGCCGLYRTQVVKELTVPGGTHVEDLDLTWCLIEKGFKVHQSARFYVYTQECTTLRQEVERWKRWNAGYCVCLRKHGRFILSRFGLLVMLPTMLIGMLGIVVFYLLPIILYYTAPGATGSYVYLVPDFMKGWFPWWLIISPLWFFALFALSIYSAKIHGRWDLILYSPLSIIFMFVSFWCWVRWGIPALITGREPVRTKPERY